RERSLAEVHHPKPAVDLSQKLAVKRRLLESRGGQQVIPRDPELVDLDVRPSERVVSFAHSEIVLDFEEEPLRFIESGDGLPLVSEKARDPSESQLDLCATVRRQGP